MLDDGQVGSIGLRELRELHSLSQAEPSTCECSSRIAKCRCDLGSEGILYVTSSSPFAATVWEFDPSTGQLGNNLGSKAYTTSQIYSGSYRWAEVAFQTPIKQFSGKALAFTITSSLGFGPAISDSSLYAGGSFFEYSGESSVALASRDLTFQTLVIPVPEPDLPLLVGSALIMWGMVRRRRQEPMISPIRKSSR